MHKISTPKAVRAVCSKPLRASIPNRTRRPRKICQTERIHVPAIGPRWLAHTVARSESNRINAPARFTVSAPSDTSLTKYDVEARRRISEIAASRIIDRSTSFRSSAPPSPWLRWARPIYRSTHASTCLGVPGPTDGGCVCALVTIWLVNHQSNAVAYPPLPSKFRPQHRHKSNRRRCCGTQATPATRGHLDRVRFGWGRSSDRSLQDSLDGPARAQTGQGASVAKRRR